MNKLNFDAVSRLNVAHLEELIELDEGNPRFAKGIVALVRAQSPLRLDAIRVALDKNDYDEIGTQVHALKSSLHNAGAHRASTICKTIELVVQAEWIDHETLRALVPLLSVEMALGLSASDNFLSQRRRQTRRAV